MNDNKTFLITGATGIIGSQIVNKLLKMNNINIIALSRDEAKLQKMFGKYNNNDTFKCVVKDIGSYFDLSSITMNHPVDVIFHAAGPMSNRAIVERPVDVINPNIQALGLLLDGLVSQQSKIGINGRIVIFSSVTVYGINSQHDIVVNESCTTHADPLDNVKAVYSESKRMAEIMAYAYTRQYGIDTVIARIGTVYGATLFPPETAFYDFINKTLSCKDIHIKSSNLPKRDNIYVEDVISGLFTILEKGTTGEAYNISSGGKLGNFAAVDEIAECMTKIANEEFSSKIKVIYDFPKEQDRQPGVILDNKKLESLGWRLGTELFDGLKSSLLNQVMVLRNN